MSLLIAIAAIAVSALYIYLLSRFVELGLLSLLGINLYQLAFGLKSSMIGTLHLDASDVVYICMLAAGVIRTVQRFRTLSVPRALELTYLLIFAISLLRGFGVYGVVPTSNEGRAFVSPLVALLYFLDAPVNKRALHHYVRMYLWFGAALCIITLLAAAGFPLGIAALPGLAAQSEAMNGRYLPAAGAAAIALCGFLSLAKCRYHSRGFLGQLLPAMYFAVAIYLRHRTVWVMLLAGTAMLLPLDPRLFRWILPATTLAMITVTALVVYGTGSGNLPTKNQFAESATDEGTWVWRVEGWKEELFDDEQTPFTVAMGKSLGGSFWRIDRDTHLPTTAPPHSEYITEYLRVGVVGTFCILFFFFAPLIWMWKNSRALQLAAFPSMSAWAIIVLMILAFGVTYSVDTDSFALVGIANAIMLGLRRPQTAGAVEELLWGPPATPISSQRDAQEC